MVKRRRFPFQSYVIDLVILKFISSFVAECDTSSIRPQCPSPDNSRQICVGGNCENGMNYNTRSLCIHILTCKIRDQYHECHDVFDACDIQAFQIQC